MAHQELREALTFDDVLLLPQSSDLLPANCDVSTALTAKNPPAYPTRLESDGHRHRIAHGDRNRANGRHRLCASQSFDRGAGGRSRDRQEI